jgi:O-methyltransferase involved in polyketide biosynthesis
MASDGYLSKPELRSSPGSDELTEQQVKVEVTLKGVAETLFIPLAARAFDATTQRPILGDSYVKGVLDKLDYDFDKAALTPGNCAKVALRTRQFDRWTASFLAAHPHSTVLHLACGLDSRAQRVEWGSDVRWIDVDLPEVVALRRQVLPQSFSKRDYRLIGASVTDSTWLEDIPVDRPTVVVMEGLLSYLIEEDVEGLLSRLVERLQEGELLFECVNVAVLSSLRKGNINSVERTGAQFNWAVDDLKKVQDIHPNLEILESILFFFAPGVDLLCRGTGSRGASAY